uniref:Beta-galactosidase n=1 Tax=uncultured Planctomycetota bacterium TaxID=120965 RepID=H5SLY3_9BACT|nr:hypothetical protein HGMM_F48A06C12 [uncultured Planctomycetota bacterium]
MLGLLLCLSSSIPQQNRPQAELLPALEVRVRVLALQGKPPGQTKFTLHVTGISGTQSLAGDSWSPWLAIDKQAWQAILKGYPNSYLGRFPVSWALSVNPHQGDLQLEVEVRLTHGKNLLLTKAHLFGPRLGLLLYPAESGQFCVATQADYNQRYWQAFGTKPGQAVPKIDRLIVVDRYIGGDDDRRAWHEGIMQLAGAGFSAIMVPPSRPIREILAQAGTSKTSWAVYNPPGYAFPFDPKITPESINAWAKQLADGYLKAGFAPTDMVLFAMSDEPGWYYPAMFKQVRENPQALQRFRDYVRQKHLNPQDLGAKSWDEIYPLGRSQVNDLPSKRLYYWTMRYYSWESARHFSDCVRALEKAFYPGIPVFTNWNFFAGRFYVPGPVANNPDKKHPDAAMGGHDWFEFARLRGGTMLWTEDWFSDAQAYQWSFYCSKLRSAAAKSNIQFGGYVIPRTAGDREDGIIQKILCIFGHGGKAVKYFVFGPEYNFPGNCYSEKAHLLRKLREAHGLLAAAEDYIHPGKVPSSPVAILMPRSAQLWDCKEMTIAQGISDATNTNLNAATVDYMAEVFDIYLALQHANIPVEFIDEDDLTEAALKNFRVVYVTEPNVPREGQQALLTWLRQGGTLVTITNAATADRYDEPCNLIGQATGVAEKSRSRLLVPDANRLPVAGTLDLEKEKPTIYGVRGELMPNDYQVLVRFADKAPAIVEKPYERGRLVHYAFLPGISYWRSATARRDRLPVGFSDALRHWLTYPVRAAKVNPPVEVTRVLVETPLLVSDKGAALTLLNWSGEAINALEMRVRLPFAATQVRSVRGEKVNWRQEQELLYVSLPLKSADIIVIERR